jgi:ribosomal protein L11 methyltransferase
VTEGAGSTIEMSLSVDGEAAEAVSALFDRYAGGAVIETRPGSGGAPDEHTVRAYIPADDVEARARIEVGLWHLSQIYPIGEAAVRRLADANWAEAWKADYRPLRIGRTFLVTPGWLEPEPAPGDRVIRIDPGMAFGTGLHPSTQLCLEALERLVCEGHTVLDVGTGSGILAIGAALLGAERVVAIDIDPAAIDSATANARSSGVLIETRRGEMGVVTGERYDVVAANLLAPTITDLSTDLHSATRAGGILVVSGILEDQADAVAAALTTAGFEPPAPSRRGDWVALSARRPEAAQRSR